MNLVLHVLPVWQVIGPLAVEAALAVIIIGALACVVKPALWRRALWQVCLAGLLILSGAETTGVVRPILGHLWLRFDAVASEANRRGEGTSPSVHLSSDLAKSATGPVNAFSEQPLSGARRSALGTSMQPFPQEPGKAFLEDNSDFTPFPAAYSASAGLVVRLGLLWVAGSALYFVWLAISHIALLLMYRKRAALADAALAEIVATLSEPLGIRRRIRVIECELLKTPVAFGMLRPTIGLPKGFRSTFDLRQQKAMLAHELAHLALRDPAWQLLGKFVAALLWWHPLVWWARRQWHLASECAADEAGVLVAGGPDALAECLLRFGERLSALPGVGRLGISGDGFRSSLGRRVARLLEMRGRALSQPKRAPRMLLQLFGPAVLVVAIGFAAAWATPKIFASDSLNQGDTVMKTIHQSWQRSLFAVTLAAALSGKPESSLAGDAPKAEPTPETSGTSEPAVQPAPQASANSAPSLHPRNRGMSGEMARRYGLSPEMARRYGLFPAQVPVQAESPAANSTPQPTPADDGEAEEESDASPKPLTTIDPVLAARYGLLPGKIESRAAEAPDPVDQPATYQRILRELGEQQAKHRELSTRYKAKYPDMVRVQQEIARLTSEKEALEAASDELDPSAQYQHLLRELHEQRERHRQLSNKFKDESPIVKEVSEQIAQLLDTKRKLESENPNLRSMQIAQAARPAAASEPQPEQAESPEEDSRQSQPRFLMDPVLAARYGLLRPGMAMPTNAMMKAGTAARAAKGRQAVRAKLEEIILEEVLYDGLPLSEVVKDLKQEAARRDPKKRGINFLINSASREAGPGGVDPTTGAPLFQQPIDIGSAIIRVNLGLKDVRLIDVLDVIKKVSEVPIRYSIEDYGVVFSPAPAQPVSPMLSRTFKVEAATLTQGLENVAGLSVNRTASRGGTQSQQLTGLLREFLASAGVTIDSPNQVFYNDRTGILMIRMSEQEQDIVQAAIEMLSGERAVLTSPANPQAAPGKPRAEVEPKDKATVPSNGREQLAARLREEEALLQQKIRDEPDDKQAPLLLQMIQMRLRDFESRRDRSSASETDQKDQNGQSSPKGFLQDQIRKLNQDAKEVEAALQKAKEYLQEHPDDEAAKSSLKEAERKRDWVEVKLKWFQRKMSEAGIADSVNLAEEGAAREGRDVAPSGINTEQPPPRAIVIGRVMKAGPVRLPEGQRMDLIQALAQAGGFQPTANQNKVELSRNGETTIYRFKDLRKIADDSQKIWLQPGDVIEVKESIF